MNSQGAEEPAAGAAQLLSRLGLRARSWSTPPHNRWLSAGLFILELDDGRRAVLKHLRRQASSAAIDEWERHWSVGAAEPRRWNYWRREVHCYEEGLPELYRPGGMAGPRLLASEVGDDEALLLTEYVAGLPGERWNLELFGGAAECLGRAQGFLCRTDWASGREWLSTDFLRQYSSEKPVDFELLGSDELWGHGLARQCLPAGLREGLALLHAERERLWQINRALPRSLCHLDFWPKNLFSTGREFVLIDWGFAGSGAVGEDIGNLVPDCVLDHFRPAAELEELERLALDGYIAGLRASGWSEDPALVQLAVWSSAVKYDWLGPFTLGQLPAERQLSYGGGGEIDPHFKFSERGRVLQYLVSWAERALQLADRLGL